MSNDLPESKPEDKGETNRMYLCVRREETVRGKEKKSEANQCETKNFTAPFASRNSPPLEADTGD